MTGCGIFSDFAIHWYWHELATILISLLINYYFYFFFFAGKTFLNTDYITQLFMVSCMEVSPWIIHEIIEVDSVLKWQNMPFSRKMFLKYLKIYHFGGSRATQVPKVSHLPHVKILRLTKTFSAQTLWVVVLYLLKVVTFQKVPEWKHSKILRKIRDLYNAAITKIVGGQTSNSILFLS